MSLPTAPASGRRLLGWGLLLTILVAGTVGARWQWYVHRRTAALSQAAEGDFDGAEAQLKEIATRSPDDVAVTAALAKGCLAAGAEDRAEQYLNRWCELAPDDAEPRSKRLNLRRQQ